jgi:hypothetical protein
VTSNLFLNVSFKLHNFANDPQVFERKTTYRDIYFAIVIVHTDYILHIQKMYFILQMAVTQIFSGKSRTFMHREKTHAEQPVQHQTLFFDKRIYIVMYDTHIDIMLYHI